MAWDFCADQDFQPTLDWVQQFVDGELRPIEPLLAYLSSQEAKSLLDPLKDQCGSEAYGQCICRKTWAATASASCRWRR
jgi:hypothetical protein